MTAYLHSYPPSLHCKIHHQVLRHGEYRASGRQLLSEQCDGSQGIESVCSQ